MGAPRRTGLVGLILYKNGLFSSKLILIPEGFSIYNVELYLGCGGNVARSAGTSVKIINKYANKYNKMLLKFRSGEEYFVNANCGATIGVCSNSAHWLRSWKKAGIKRLFGFRSKVRG